jgi:hypothetical protein
MKREIKYTAVEILGVFGLGIPYAHRFGTMGEFCDPEWPINPTEIYVNSSGDFVLIVAGQILLLSKLDEPNKVKRITLSPKEEYMVGIVCKYNDGFVLSLVPIINLELPSLGAFLLPDEIFRNGSQSDVMPIDSFLRTGSWFENKMISIYTANVLPHNSGTKHKVLRLPSNNETYSAKDDEIIICVHPSGDLMILADLIDGWQELSYKVTNSQGDELFILDDSNGFNNIEFGFINEKHVYCLEPLRTRIWDLEAKTLVKAIESDFEEIYSSSSSINIGNRRRIFFNADLNTLIIGNKVAHRLSHNPSWNYFSDSHKIVHIDFDWNEVKMVNCKNFEPDELQTENLISIDYCAETQKLVLLSQFIIWRPDLQSFNRTIPAFVLHHVWTLPFPIEFKK